MHVEISRDVAASPAHTFAAATNLREATRFVRAITRLEVLTDGPVGKGTRFRETRTMFGREATEEMEVLEFDPPRVFALGAENHGCRYRSEFRFVPIATGTRLEMHFHAEALTFFARVMSRLMAPLAKKMMKECGRDLEDIAREAEARAAR